jgi:hypothetical protein
VPDYAANAATAAAKIAEFGKSITVQAPATGGGAWDSEGSRPEPVAASFLETGYGITHRQEAAVKAGDVVGLLDNSTAVEAGWTLILDGVALEIVDAQRVQPGDTLIMTEIIARR